MDENIAHSQDAVDDGEIGASRRMLQKMIDESYYNREVFVVRYHSGRNLGTARFKIILDIADKALKAVPEDFQAALQRQGVPVQQNFGQIRRPAITALRGACGGSGRTRARGSSVAAKVLTYDRLTTPPARNVTEEKDY